MPFIQDLKSSLKGSKDKNGMLKLLALDLKEQISKRLIVPSISTRNIFYFYIYLVEILHHVEPKNELESIVCAPIKELIKSRKNSIKTAIDLINKSTALYQ